ncbi:homeobox-leucine zipper protein HOX11-like [Populus alba x Populus x berolinensis]|uniref:Homeobox-leucine zipper protein HOX11-like n=1 Tax=Populus alba x Populus x berolinensis TaxID=444605 RepID=A0AAD6QAZ0_9ROSI|nr:homeobox-leucine zipper protein HOX11-like [Populus alba x Populus x berolinensis]
MQNKREMELGLSLGDAATTSKPFGFMEKSTQLTNKVTSGFCMGLSIGTNHTLQEEDEDKDDHKLSNNIDHNSDNTDTRTATVQANKGTILTVDTSTDPPIQLDLLPNTPVPRNQNSILTLASDNGTNFEAGSSGNMSRGFDVNRFSAVMVHEDQADQDGATLSSSPPNSATSSFQMDFCIYSSKGGSGSNIEADQAERASSRASDEDENGSARKKLRLSKEQSSFLEESFKEHNTLTPKQKLALAKELNLRPRQVEVWFQNRRARTKLKQTEVDCEYLKRCCETLTEENRRLHKELQELRALKTSNPYYMQLPATTLTMCPSCERVAAAATSATATIATTTATTTNTQNNTTDPTSKTTGLSLSSSRPRFYPFSNTQTHPHQPKA